MIESISSIFDLTSVPLIDRIRLRSWYHSRHCYLWTCLGRTPLALLHDRVLDVQGENLFRSCSVPSLTTFSQGFPARKVPFYIAAQIFGGFIGALTVYGVYRQQLVAIAGALIAAGEQSVLFSNQGVSVEYCESCDEQSLIRLSAARRCPRPLQQRRTAAWLRLPQRIHCQHLASTAQLAVSKPR